MGTVHHFTSREDRERREREVRALEKIAQEIEEQNERYRRKHYRPDFGASHTELFRGKPWWQD